MKKTIRLIVLLMGIILLTGCKNDIDLLGIDFDKNVYRIPDYEQVKNFGISIAERIPFHDLVALDIAIDENNNPTLLEINVGGFSAWLFQFTVGSVFGNLTHEIMQRCTTNE